MTAIFKRILVPVDFSEKNETALNVALELAGRSQAHVTLLHVIEKIEHVAEAEIRSFYEMLEANARTKLAQMSERFAAGGFTAAQEIVYGRRGREIVQYSLEHDVDLIVLSSHKVDLRHPSEGWGTLSYQVSVFCQCPILLVK